VAEDGMTMKSRNLTAAGVARSSSPGLKCSRAGCPCHIIPLSPVALDEDNVSAPVPAGCDLSMRLIKRPCTSKCGKHDGRNK
jgi:hypothetical protein